ncbi:MAG: site-2 protease family protein [archaeon]|nr:site-2 protease family protein [archaeon]
MAIKLGSIYGIPLYLDYSWFIILALIIFTVGFGVMPSQYPHLPYAEYLLLGVLSAILLFVSIVVHELAHSIIAKRNGLMIGRITLYLLGGVSEMTEEPPNPSLELRMSAAGPITSLAIAGASYVAWIASTSVKASVIIQGPLYYSALFNLIVAGFNLIPAFPMDGGRVLRSIVWRLNGDMIRSTKVASNVGRIFAYLMMFGGILLAFLYPGYFFDGIWLVLIGWFISSGAQHEYKQVQMMRDVADLKARDMMTRNVDRVPEDITLTDLSSQFLQRKHNGFPVMRGDELIGCVTMHDLRGTKRELWDSTRVTGIMTPKEKLVTVKETDHAKKALSLMGSNQIGRIFVLSDDMSGRLVGIITRTDVMRTIQMQESFLKSAPAPAPKGSERNISVEVGMLFQIISPEYDGIAWSTSFNPGEFSLISEQIVQIAPDRQTKQFTLQALKKGTFYISLNRPGDKKTALRYTIIVS